MLGRVRMQIFSKLWRRATRSDLNDEAYGYVVQRHAANGYEFWQRLTCESAVYIPHPSQLPHFVKLMVLWDAEPWGPIRVFVSTTETGLWGVVEPVRSFIVYPDGTTKT